MRASRLTTLVAATTTPAEGEVQTEATIMQQFNAQFEHFGDDAPALPGSSCPPAQPEPTLADQLQGYATPLAIVAVGVGFILFGRRQQP